jgi:Tol biopolymer transport system component
MEESDAKLIAGTEGNPDKPFFSLDGKWVGYWSGSEHKLKKITISGGAPLTIADAASVGSYSWMPDDTIVFGQYGKGVMQISANGGMPKPVVMEEKKYTIHPQILPDRQAVLYTDISSTPEKVMLQLLQSGERRELFPGSQARYLPTGHIIYGLDNNLLAVPFDLKTLKVTRGAVPVVENILRLGGAFQYAVSDSGALAYLPGLSTDMITKRTLVWVDRDGKEEPLPAPINTYFHPRVSPDGTRVAVGVYHQAVGVDTYIWNLVRKTLTRLTFDSAEEDFPLWTADGKKIIFYSEREGNRGIYLKSADGTGKEELIKPLESSYSFPGALSRDGKALLIQMENSIDVFSIVALPMEKDGKEKPLLQGKYRYIQPRISPDGRWLAYTSNEFGRNEIFVRPYPEVDSGMWQISSGGGDSALWSPDSRELFYRNGEEVMAVPVMTDRAFNFESPKILFRGTYIQASFILGTLELSPWDIHPDGKRFLMIKAAGTSSAEGPRRIRVVVNWFEELKQHFPAK